MSTECTLVAPYFVVVWRTRELSDLKRVRGELERAVRNLGTAVHYVGVMTRATAAASEEFRASLGDFSDARSKLCTAVHLVYEGDDADSIVERATVQTILRAHHLRPVVVRSIGELVRSMPRAERGELRQALAVAGVLGPSD